MEIRKPRRISRTYTQRLEAPPEVVFPLLCPVREIDWANGWDPSLVISKSGLAEPACIFVTPGTPQDSVWVITRHDPEQLHLEMLKITPGHTVGKIEIRLSAQDGGNTKADVSYTYTSLGPAGDAFLNQLTEETYVEFMEEWERELNHYVSTGEKLPQ